jgi:hypothetical protein
MANITDIQFLALEYTDIYRHVKHIEELGHAIISMHCENRSVSQSLGRLTHLDARFFSQLESKMSVLKCQHKFRNFQQTVNVLLIRTHYLLVYLLSTKSDGTVNMFMIIFTPQNECERFS